ncbi:MULTISPECIES: starch-binding protein [unclassified Clostridium]|uniref:starch-binding protein n=1 Tax=unclassified Clostridium TaxID=2614128 RepID=UPI001C8B51D2|nr:MULTISPECIES: starch-binding protein [unclassified Clostridium]MBX9137638.1 starch-binding protein [Clostridium sp. K12(2020)]MBX9144448.1 starch-binding protein [Clostridium sp. K13]
MRNKNKITSFLIALVFALSLVFNNITGLITVNATSLTKGAVNTIDDGSILHAWNWSFDTIKSKLPEIKEAGYTAVQTSPIQGNKEDLMANSKWWILYQPTNFKIGNAQLGNREQFKSMCEEADKYGIDIIVDVVANHTGNRGGGNDSYYPATNVDSAIKDDESLWHEHKGVSDWNNRWQVTHLGIGLPDLNTSSWKLQDMVINFLNDAIACGADGFRFDAAKHIELPDDDGGSDFWTRVLGSLNNKENLFIYGEVLQGGADRINAYHNYMRTTCDWYGGSVRSAVGYNSIANANSAKSYTVSGAASNLVTWVESHDTYANDHKETVALTNEQIKLGWAIIAGRADSTPLFFNRTSGGYLAGNMGAAGDDMWKDPIVVAANNFRNAMAGEGEYIRTQGNDLFITERGQSGVMIVNVSGSTSVNCETKLPNGEYTDSVSGNKFVVSNGKLTGNIGSRTIATIYARPVIKTPEVSSSVASGTKFKNSLNITLGAINTKSSTYSVNGGNEVTYTNGETITLGADAKVGDIITLALTGIGEDGTNVSKEYKYEKVDIIENATAKIKLPSGWSSANIYVYDESVTPTKVIEKWPGVAMTNEGNGVYSYTLPEGWGDKTQVIFNNGSNQIPAAQQPGFVLPTNSNKIYKDGSWIDNEIPAPEVSSSIADGTEFSNSLNVTLNAKNTIEATYSINGESAKTYTNGKVITLGEDVAVGETVKLTLTGKNSEGKTITVTYSYKRVEAPVVTTSIAKIKLPSGWSSANIYVYDESVAPTKEIAKWPGVAMTNEGNGIYSYTLPEGWGDKTQVIFNNGSAQIPAAQQPGFVLPTNSNKIYKDGSWIDNEIPAPEVSSSIADGTEFSNSLNVTLNAKNTIEATYSINGESAKTYTNGKVITLGEDVAVGETVKLTLTGKNSEGKTITVTYSYKRVEAPVVTTSIAKIKLPSGWSSANIYVYDESVSPTKEITKWPGVAMTNEGNGIYSYTLPEGWGENTQVIFNNGNAQVPGAQQPGFNLPENKIGTYENGNWTLTDIVRPIQITSFAADKLSPQVEETTIGLSVKATGGNGTLQYKFTCKNTVTNTEKLIRDYSNDSNAEWTPLTAGTYKVIVTVKDSKGNTKEDSFEFKIDPKYIDIVLNSLNLDKTEVSAGEEISISADAKGGIGSLTYKFYYKKGVEYTLIKDHSSEASIKWIPEESGEYYVYVDVMDSAGNIKCTSKKVTVSKKAVEITDVSVDKTTIRVGDSVNIITTAIGGSNLQYRVAVHDFENTWTTLHDFKDSNITAWKPEIADKYVIWVDVIDEDGDYASKSIEVTVIE